MARSERSASTRRFMILYLLTLGSGLGRRRKSGPLVSLDAPSRAVRDTRPKVTHWFAPDENRPLFAFGRPPGTTPMASGGLGNVEDPLRRGVTYDQYKLSRRPGQQSRCTLIAALARGRRLELDKARGDAVPKSRPPPLQPSRTSACGGTKGCGEVIARRLLWVPAGRQINAR
jgi:hypothetical protein